MAKKKRLYRTEAQILKDRYDASRLFNMGYSPVEISVLIEEKTGRPISPATIRDELAKAREHWREDYTGFIHAEKIRELARIDMLITELWDSYHLSKEDAYESEEEEVDDNWGEGSPQAAEGGKPAAYQRKRKKVKTASRDGTAAFVREIRGLIDMKAKILGIYAPTKSEHTMSWRDAAKEQGLESEAVSQFERLVQYARSMGGDEKSSE